MIGQKEDAACAAAAHPVKPMQGDAIAKPQQQADDARGRIDYRNHKKTTPYKRKFGNRRTFNSKEFFFLL
jgi:hypothetical protein